MARPDLIPSHSYADLFPLDDGQNLLDLADDLKENGQHVVAWVFQSKLLDGRRRQLACIRAGIPFKTKEFKGTEAEALRLVVSLNIHRRHLSTGDRALIAANIANLPKGRPSSENASNEAFNSEAPVTQEEAAEMLNVSRASVQRAATVLEGGSANLQAAVTAGTVSISDAAAIVGEPKKVQNAALKSVESGVATTLQQAVANAKTETNGEVNGHTEPEPEPTPVDAEGHAVTEQTAAAFKTAEQFDEMLSHCRALQKGINAMVREPGGEQMAMHTRAIGPEGKTIQKTEELEGLKRHLKLTRPHSICPHCAGKAKAGCHGCSGRGWVSSVTWKNTEESVKGKLETVK